MPNLKPSENVIAIVPDATQSQRLVFIAKSGQHDLPIVLRQESYSEGVGWFTQNQIEMSRQQMLMLRSAMGGTGGISRHSSSSGPRMGDVTAGNGTLDGPTSFDRTVSSPDLTPAVIPFSRPIDRERVGA